MEGLHRDLKIKRITVQTTTLQSSWLRAFGSCHSFRLIVHLFYGTVCPKHLRLWGRWRPIRRIRRPRPSPMGQNGPIWGRNRKFQSCRPANPETQIQNPPSDALGMGKMGQTENRREKFCPCSPTLSRVIGPSAPASACFPRSCRPSSDPPIQLSLPSITGFGRLPESPPAAKFLAD